MKHLMKAGEQNGQNVVIISTKNENNNPSINDVNNDNNSSEKFKQKNLIFVWK